MDMYVYIYIYIPASLHGDAFSILALQAPKESAHKGFLMHSNDISFGESLNLAGCS